MQSFFPLTPALTIIFWLKQINSIELAIERTKYLVNKHMVWAHSLHYISNSAL